MVTEKDRYKTGRLTAKPAPIKGQEVTAATGIEPLGLGGTKDGLLYVPAGYAHDRPSALAVMLHGAGGQAQHGLSLLKGYADEHNILLLAPASRAATWDIIASKSFGPDVLYIDQALALVFARYAVDAARVAIGGFSDGASYALCLGLTNGDLFTHILAFSPGFSYTVERHGKPAVFVSHGTQDQVLPIDPCSRCIVPRLLHQGIRVEYKEFVGAHEVPGVVSRSGVEWFMQDEAEAV